jgi:hypothetical protein
LIRVGVDVPAGAEFAIDHVDDPFECAGDERCFVVPTPAALDEPAFSQRGDVGRP